MGDHLIRHAAQHYFVFHCVITGSCVFINVPINYSKSFCVRLKVTTVVPLCVQPSNRSRMCECNLERVKRDLQLA